MKVIKLVLIVLILNFFTSCKHEEKYKFIDSVIQHPDSLEFYINKYNILLDSNSLTIKTYFKEPETVKKWLNFKNGILKDGFIFRDYFEMDLTYKGDSIIRRELSISVINPTIENLGVRFIWAKYPNETEWKFSHWQEFYPRQ